MTPPMQQNTGRHVDEAEMRAPAREVAAGETDPDAVHPGPLDPHASALPLDEAAITGVPLQERARTEGSPAKARPAGEYLRPVPIGEIAVPQGRRPVSRTWLPRFMKSIASEGLLQPIAVRVTPTGPRLYELVSGRHRLEACRRLGWSEIPARVLDLDDDMAVMAGIAENVFSQGLTKKQFERQLARWEALYQLRYPETRQHTAGGVGRARKSRMESGSRRGGDAAKDRAEPFPQIAADRLGVSRRTAERMVRRSRSFSDAAYEVFEQCGVGSVQRDAIAAIADPERRAACIRAIGQGLESAEAIDRYSYRPDGGAKDDRSGGKASDGQMPNESGMSDADWLQNVCGGIRRRLASTERFDAHAIYYRRIDEARREFKASVQPLLDQLPDDVRRTGLAGAVWRVCHIDHPKEWRVCETCGGTGRISSGSRCVKCFENGFLPTYGTKR